MSRSLNFEDSSAKTGLRRRQADYRDSVLISEIATQAPVTNFENKRSTALRRGWEGEFMTTEHNKTDNEVLPGWLGFDNSISMPGLGFLTIAIGSHGAASPPTR